MPLTQLWALVFFTHSSSTMAEKEDSPEKISTIQDIPGESVSMEGQSSANSMVQALVADQSVLAAI